MRSKTRVQTVSEAESLKRQLAESEARFHAIIDRNADAIVVVDHQGTIRFLNAQAARLFCGTVEGLIGTQFGFPLVAGETTELDLVIDGSVVAVEMRVVETQWAGEPACIASLRDMTERRQAEQARAADRAKSELLAVISHDLRTPLNAVIGYGQLLLMGIPDPLPAAARDRVERMLAAAHHQLFLIDELLTFARIESDHEHLQQDEIDAFAVAREAAAIVQPAAQQRGIALTVELPPQPHITRTDPDKLRQVLINLLSNAVKYTADGEVKLAASVTAEALVFRVSDTGIGISPEDLPHIFEPFWQADRSQRARGEGTGLGLSVVNQVIKLLGGTVMAESEPGRGSIFTVRLPVAA